MTEPPYDDENVSWKKPLVLALAALVLALIIAGRACTPDAEAAPPAPVVSPG